jgi:peptidoglycan hydrolase CwlO-like protein
MFTDIVELVKSYGPSLAGWVLLISFIAWIAGQGGILAVRNVKSLLDTGEDLRGRQKKALDDCELQIERRDMQIRELTGVIQTAQRTMRQMTIEMNAMEDKILSLTRELDHHKGKDSGR